MTNTLSRRNFLLNTTMAAAGIVAAPLFSLGNDRFLPVKPAVSDALTPNNASALNGFIGQKLDLSYQNRILAQDVDSLVEPFRHRKETRMWQTEFWGKWFTSAILAYRYKPTPALKARLDAAVSGLLSTQTTDGYIGNYKPANRLEQWDIWGRKYCLLGLLDYYDLFKNEAALQASARLADHLIKELDEHDGIIVTKGNYRGMAASSVLEPMVRLYNRTGNKKYLDLCEEIVRQWETPQGPQLISKAAVNVGERFEKPGSWYSWEQGQKAYEMMSCYEGLLELYRVTGKPGYLQAVEQTWQNIRDTEINIAGSGASEEMWFGGKKLQAQHVAHYQETCVTVTWIKLNQQLLRLTGEAKYADEIERSYYNALMASLNADGSDWAKYTPLVGERLPGSGQCGMDLNCCVASGPRAQFTLPHTAVMSWAKGVAINFYIDGSYTTDTPDIGKTTVIQRTEYPLNGKVEISIQTNASNTMSVKLRIPSWAGNATVSVNDKPIGQVKAGDFVEIERKWSPADKILIDLKPEGRLQTIDGNSDYAAITYGPMVLARDTRLGPPDLSTVHQPVVKDGFIALTQVAPSHKNWMEFSSMFIPEAYTETGPKPVSIRLMDYASAGNGKEKSTFRVWLPQIMSKRLHG